MFFLQNSCIKVRDIRSESGRIINITKKHGQESKGQVKNKITQNYGDKQMETRSNKRKSRRRKDKGN